MLFRSALMFDLRSAPFGTPHEQIYPAALDMIEFADRKGFDNVILAEHHASPDGYCPVPAVFAAAAGARTKDIMITLCALVLPLHDPVKLAETIAVTDLVCGGRLHTVLVAGYAHHEFAMFRKSMKQRGRAMDHGTEVIMRALSGERFMDGDREVFVRPIPKAFPKLYIGGGVPASAARAARFGLGFNPLSPDLDAVYVEECRKLGTAPGPIFGRSVGTHCTENVEQAWADIGEYILWMARSYAAISADPNESNSPLHGLDTIEKVRASGMIQVLTPDQCVELARTRHLSLMPLISGLPPEIGWKSLELFADKALPRIQEMNRADRRRS
ncbi:MAG: LLM class flavin-dependent oxidoreductase [Sphingomonadales bacterium]|nr:LLM class flavin-dependent oxidoreductase [Sphingomonadales bacterium]